MEYEVYRHSDASDQDFQFIDGMFKQVLKEDKELCEGVQQNLNAGIFMNGELHPQAEKVGTQRSLPLISVINLNLNASGRVVLPVTHAPIAHESPRGGRSLWRGNLAGDTKAQSLPKQ